MKILPRITLFVFALIEHAFAQNASYDAQGRLTSDPSSGITVIEWNNMGKVSRVVAKENEIEYFYDVRGSRTAKLVKPKNDGMLSPPSSWSYTYYQYDASGSEVSRYTRRFVRQGASEFSDEFAKKEQVAVGGRHEYEAGETRIAARFTATESSEFESIVYRGVVIPPSGNNKSGHKGQKRYEMVSHGKNVTSVVSDRKKELKSELLFAQDYYPFGMTMADRTYEKENYFFGFAGKETDPEVIGAHNSYDFGARLYNPQLGRWWSLDAKAAKYPRLSPYNYGNNSPVQYGDFDGNDITWLTNKNFYITQNPQAIKQYEAAIKATRELIQKSPETSKIFQEAENNVNIQVYITFSDVEMMLPNKSVGNTSTLTHRSIDTRDTGERMESKVNENGSITLQNQKLSGFDISKEVHEGREIYFIQISIVDPVASSLQGGLYIYPAYYLASVLAHEVEAHVNITERNNPYQQFAAGLGFCWTAADIEHMMYGSHAAVPVIIKDGKPELMMDYVLPGDNPARRNTIELFNGDKDFHQDITQRPGAVVEGIQYQRQKAAEKKAAEAKAKTETQKK